MTQSKAFQILSALTKDEFVNFSRFISSPYFNRSKDLINLNNFLKPFYPGFHDSKISYEKIYKKLYDIYNYYKAFISFYEKKYDKSNDYLSKIVNDSPFIRLDAKTLRMRNYYELSYFDSAFSQVDSFKQFLKRNKSISPVRRNSYSNFLKFYSGLLKKKSGMKIDIPSLADEVITCKRVRNKDWLMEKLAELN